jgi:hypothetical protein
VGDPNGTAEIPDDQTGQLLRVPVPPDPAHLERTASATGGHALAARSAAELNAAIDDLARRAGLIAGRPER